jgi:hypothetical protein
MDLEGGQNVVVAVWAVEAQPLRIFGAVAQKKSGPVQDRPMTRRHHMKFCNGA